MARTRIFGIVWFKVTDGETTGWSSAEWLVASNGPEAPGSAQAEFGVNEWVRVSTNNGDNLNMRHSARVWGGLVDTIANGARLLVSMDHASMPMAMPGTRLSTSKIAAG